MTTSPRCIATPARIRWAQLRAGKQWRRTRYWGCETIEDARQMAVYAGVPLAALFLPDPSRLELARAWLRGKL